MFRQKKTDQNEHHGNRFSKLMRKTHHEAVSDKKNSSKNHHQDQLSARKTRIGFDSSNIFPTKTHEKSFDTLSLAHSNNTMHNDLISMSTSTSATVYDHVSTSSNQSDRTSAHDNENFNSRFKHAFLRSHAKKGSSEIPLVPKLPAEPSSASLVNLKEKDFSVSTTYTASYTPQHEGYKTFPSDTKDTDNGNIMSVEQLMTELDLLFSPYESKLIKWCWSDNSAVIDTSQMVDDMYAARKANSELGLLRNGSVGNTTPSFSYTFQSEKFWISVCANVENVSPEVRELLPPVSHLQKAFASIIRMMVVNIDDLASMKEFFFKLGRVHERLFNSSNDIYNILGDAINDSLLETYGDFYTSTIENLWMALYAFMASCMLVSCENDVLLPDADVKLAKPVHNFT